MYYVSKHAKSNYNYIAECIQSLHIIQILVIIFNFIWLDYFFQEKSIPLYLGCPSLESSPHPHKIYLTEYSETKKKLILLVSGLYYQDYNPYMEKVYLDLSRNPDIREKYMFMIYENRNKSNFHIAEDISHYLKKIVEKYCLEEVSIIGFSAGGIVASHIMHHLKHIPIEKKVITYDCPLDIYNMLIYQYNNYSRLDIYFYMIIRFFYERNTWEILFDTAKKHIRKVGDKPVVFELVKKIYDKTDEEIMQMSEICLDQDDKTIFHFVNCMGDPVFEKNIRDGIIQKAREKNFTVKVHEKPWIGHCSDMTFSDSYMFQLLDALRSRTTEIESFAKTT